MQEAGVAEKGRAGPRAMHWGKHVCHTERDIHCGNTLPSSTDKAPRSATHHPQKCSWDTQSSTEGSNTHMAACAALNKQQTARQDCPSSSHNRPWLARLPSCASMRVAGARAASNQSSTLSTCRLPTELVSVAVLGHRERRNRPRPPQDLHPLQYEQSTQQQSASLVVCMCMEHGSSS